MDLSFPAPDLEDTLPSCVALYLTPPCSLPLPPGLYFLVCFAYLSLPIADSFFCIPPRPIMLHNLFIPSSGNPSVVPWRASCPTEQSLPLTWLSRRFQAVPGLSDSSVQRSPECRVLLSWAQPVQEETKGVSLPFPGVPMSHPVLNTCHTPSLRAKL